MIEEKVEIVRISSLLTGFSHPHCEQKDKLNLITVNLLSFVTFKYFEKLDCVFEVISTREIFLKYGFLSISFLLAYLKNSFVFLVSLFISETF